MNKKLIALVLCLIMAVSVTMTACNPDPVPSTTQKPTGSQTTDPTPYVPKDVKVNLVVINDTGKECPNTTMIIKAKNSRESYDVQADDKGLAEIILTEGEYTIIFDQVPEYHLAPNVDLTVTYGMSTVTLELTNNEPNGTEERPFVLGDKNDTKHYAANEMFWFKIRVGEGRSVKIRNANAELVYEGTTYTPDENGEIIFHMQSDNPKAQIMFTVTNKSNEEQDIELILEGDPGTHDNPIIVPALNETMTAIVVGGDSVYFRYAATQTGTLVLNCEDPNNFITLLNHSNSVKTEATNGTATVSLAVTAGDIVTIEVSVVTPVDGGDEISFTLSME